MYVATVKEHNKMYEEIRRQYTCYYQHTHSNMCKTRKIIESKCKINLTRTLRELKSLCVFIS